ncbi:C40 family peptidase [Nonomuraea sp. M3C6]|uniref:C40 family peptidase n=1 Tax=Nonomuraea marmarensis TaxID=3351344 RepID=A0ABW7AFD4_9ACTN
MNGPRPLLLIALTNAILHAPHSTPAAAANGCAAGGICAQAVSPAAHPAWATSAGGAIAVRAAIEMIGVPYSWGGGGIRGPGFGTGKGARTRGFDCSGLTEYAWARAGVLIGTTTSEQWRSGIRVPKEQVESGDLVFYDNDPHRAGPEHVGLAVDSTRMVHAPYTGQFVRVDPLERRTFMGVVRPSASEANVDSSGVTDADPPDEADPSEAADVDL